MRSSPTNRLRTTRCCSSTWLGRLGFAGLNLSGFSFRGMRLGNKTDNAERSVDFSHANLQGCDISYVQLQCANFKDAKLEGADFSHADLNLSTDFTDAKLEGANFSGSHLGLVRFPGADLTGANLKGAELYGANFDGASLNGTLMFTKAN